MKSTSPGRSGDHPIQLSPIASRFVLHWGEMGSRWGVNRTVSQIHALLYLVARPMHAEEISQALGVVRSNVSTSLKELQNWHLVRIVHRHGDRRDHFETSSDVWDLFKTVVRERKEREFDPTVAVLRECVADKAFGKEEADTQLRIREMLTLVESLSLWTDQVLRLEPETILKMMRLGSKIKKFMR